MSLFLFLHSLYSGSCPPNWVSSEDSCYYVDNTRTRKMSDARKRCREMEGDIAIIRSSHENQFIFNLVKKTAGLPFWGAWIGLQRTSDGSFKWVDGTPVEYSAWNSGEPNDTGGREDCVAMYWDIEGRWNDAPCDWEVTPGVVCQMRMPR